MLEHQDQCPLCHRESRLDRDFDRDMITVWCKGCGIYRISEEAVMHCESGGQLQHPSERARLSGVIREVFELQRGRGVPPVLLSSLQELLGRAPESFDLPGKVRKLLSALSRKSLHPGAPVPISEDVDRSLAYAENVGEFLYLSDYATTQGWIERKINKGRVYSDDLSVAPQSNAVSRDWDYKLTPPGWGELAKIQQNDSRKAFVAMWFDPRIRHVFDQAIVPAANSCGFRAVRIDAEEYNGDVVDQIIAEIKESRFVVADLTGHRNGVYFEAGYAMGLGREVIWTCRKQDADETHFDANHFNQIRWETPEELRQKLSNRIRAVIGVLPGATKAGGTP